MSNSVDNNPSDLIRRARDGDHGMLNQLIAGYRPYLKLLARLQHDVRLRAKLDDSDLVQEVSALAFRTFAGFRGTCEAEFASWLRTIMASVAAKSIRHYTFQRRDLHLERQLHAELDQTSCLLSAKLMAPEPSPSEQVMKRELAVLVASALEQLPDHYREVIILRDFQGLTPREIGDRMNRTPDAVCKLWARAILRVRDLLEGQL